MPQIDNADEARSVARLIQSGQITGAARDTAMQALRDFDTAHTTATQAVQNNGTDWLRQIGLGARAVGEGVVSALAAPHDIGVGMQNLMRRGVNAVFGTNLQPQQTEAAKLSQALDESGAYTPQTTGEQYASAGIRGVAGALTGAGALSAAGALPATVPNVIRAGVSGATGAGAAETARQADLPWWAQAAAGLAGGTIPGIVEGVASVAPNVVRPLTRGGQQQIAANILARQATNPQQAATNLETAAPVIPNSARTTGEASQDIGLMALEKGVRGKNSAPFGQRLSEQNAARQAELTAVAGTPADVAAAQAARDAATAPMRQAAFGKSGQAPISDVHDTIDRILASPVGKRETVAKSLEWAKGQIGDTTDPVALYEIRKDLQLAQRGKLQPSSPNAPNASTLSLARGQLGQVVDSLDDAIETAAPGFKAYLQRYADMSKPIDQMKIIQEIQKRAQLTSADVTTGQNFLGNANFSRALDAAIQKNGAKLTPNQMQRLNAIRTDLQYGQAINSPLVKAPGSDTFQNLSIAQVIGSGATSAHPALQALSKPLQWLYKAAGSDQKINDILTEAMLDPKLGAAMLRRATPGSVQKFSEVIRIWALSHGVGTVAGADSTSPQSPIGISMPLPTQ